MLFTRDLIALLALLAILSFPLSAQRKKKEPLVGGFPPLLEESKRKKEKPVVTEVLELPKDPPQVITVEADRLGFHVSPLSSKGLLSQQVKDALKALFGSARGASIVSIRGFIAGTGDLRRVQTIVSETFEDKRLPLPKVAVVQVGALPMDGVQVVLEATTIEKSVTAPHGIAFMASERSSVTDAVPRLQQDLKELNAQPGDLKRVTCFLDGIENAGTLRTEVAKVFPSAAANFLQSLRDSGGDGVACEAVAAAGEGAKSDGRKAVVAPGRVAWTSTQLAFGREPADFQLAFERLGKTLASAGADLKNVVFGRTYSLSRGAVARIDELWPSYSAQKPPSSSQVFESLPSLDSTAGIEVVVALKK